MSFWTKNREFQDAGWEEGREGEKEGARTSHVLDDSLGRSAVVKEGGREGGREGGEGGEGGREGGREGRKEHVPVMYLMMVSGEVQSSKRTV